MQLALDTILFVVGFCAPIAIGYGLMWLWDWYHAREDV